MKPSAQKEGRSAKCTGNGRRLGKTPPSFTNVNQKKACKHTKARSNLLKKTSTSRSDYGWHLAKKILIDIAVVKSNKHQDDGEKNTQNVR